jgi:hypothetical protein
LPDLTSQMRKIKPLRKLRYKPQRFEVIHCGSMGICAQRINPDRSTLVRTTDIDQCVEEVLAHAKMLAVALDGPAFGRVAPGIRQGFIQASFDWSAFVLLSDAEDLHRLQRASDLFIARSWFDDKDASEAGLELSVYVCQWAPKSRSSPAYH